MSINNPLTNFFRVQGGPDLVGTRINFTPTVPIEISAVETLPNQFDLIVANGRLGMKLGDQSMNNSVNFVDVDNLAIPCTANERLFFELFISFLNVAGAGIKMQFVYDVGAVVECVCAYSVDNGSVKYFSKNVSSLITGNSTGGTEGVLHVFGLVRQGNADGSVRPRFAQNVAVVGDTTIQHGSFMRKIRAEG